MAKEKSTISNSEKAVIVALAKGGVVTSVIAKAFGVPEQAVAAYKAWETMRAKKSKSPELDPISDEELLELRSNCPPDEWRDGKVSDREKVAIVALAKVGIPTAKLAATFGVPKQAVAAYKAWDTMRSN